MPKHRARSCRGSRHGMGYWKENVSGKINVSGLRCGRTVRDRIAPAIDDVLTPAAGSEKANAPHQSAPVNRKRKAWLYVPRSSIVCKARSRATKSTKVVEIAGEVAKRPGDQGKIWAV